ncbi:MAG TPA: holo-ACP synthase [Clostridiales bacterium]|jgi:holo-[acyl-carrier protein] synthase|nr:holo-ACP synthase [Clostridiales bacterium]HQP70812.1 holo-ACP synthase [Clostridiales bacterium]
MIYGIGADLIEVTRVKNSIEKIGGFKEKIFSPDEIVYCESKKNRFESYAGRFAAKEAYFKALGTGWRNGLAFNEIEIVNDSLGKPSVRLTGKAAVHAKDIGFVNTLVTITHIKETAAAFVIIEK